MDSGIVIKNNSSVVMINNNYKNLKLMRKLTIADFTGHLEKITDYDKWPTYTTPAQSGEMLCAFRRTDPDANDNIYMEPNIDGSFALQVLVGGMKSIPDGYLSDVIFYVFGFTDAMEPDNEIGMRVYDDKNNIVFNSNEKYMRIMHYNNQHEGTYDIPAGKDYAMVTMGKYLYHHQRKNTTNEWYIGFGHIYQNVAASVTYELTQNPRPAGGGYNIDFTTDFRKWFVVDVTNY